MKEALIYDTDNREQIALYVEKVDHFSFCNPDYKYKISNEKYNFVLLTSKQVDWLIKRLKAMREDD